MEHTFQLESTFELMDGTCFQEIYECDGFTYSENTPKLIQNTNHEYMCLDGTQLVYQARTRSRTGDDCRFILHTYKGTTSDIGRPVMLQIRLGERNFTVCCGQQDTIVYVREDYPVPDSFEDRRHEALFFLKEIIGRDDLKCLESGRWPTYYMSFNDPYSDSVSNELYTLLLEDILVLLQKQDEKLILKCHSKNLAGTSDTKRIFSPVIKLNTVLVRSVATDNKSFFVLSTNGAQIYELMAQTVSEQQTWLCLITQQAESMKTELPSVITLPSDGDREAVEMISAGGQKLSKDPNRNSTGSIQSPEKDVGSSPPEIMQTPSVGSNPFEDIRSDEEEEEAEQDGEEVAFVDPELGDRLPADSDDDDPYTFGYPSSIAEEALKTLEALRKVLLDHMIGQGVPEEGRQAWRDHRGRLLRTTSLRGPMDSPAAQVSAPLLSPENGAEKAAGTREPTLGDTGFFETSDDYAGSYMVLEGYGGSGESSTDDDAQAGERDPGSRWGPAGDSGIDLKKLLSSSSLSGSQPNFSRQVMTHLRLLQANLNHLKEVEAKYYRLCQKQEGPATDMYESKDS